MTSTPVAWNSLLKESGLPALEARVLLEHASQKNRTWLVAHGDEPATVASIEQFHELTQRRMNGEPIAYLVGEREFFGLKFHVSPAVLIPRPETELLVQWVIDHAENSARVLEMGTGSGCIAISICHYRPDLLLTATDISAAALLFAQSNGHLNHVNERVQWVESNWYDQLGQRRPFDLIISNPPYIAANDHHLKQGDLRFEPALALTDAANGLSAIDNIVGQATNHLNAGGWVAVEHGFDQGASSREIFHRHGFHGIQTLQDWEHRDRVSLGQLA